MTEQSILSPEQLTDLRMRVLRKEQPSLEELRIAIHTLREGRRSAENVKVAKAKKKSDKAAAGGKLDLAKVFGTEPISIEAGTAVTFTTEKEGEPNASE